MSIIHEALKKAVQDKQAGSQQTNAGSLNAGAGVIKKKSRVNWGPVFVLLVVILIAGPLVAPIFSSPFRTTNTALVVPAAKPLPTENHQAQFGMEEAPLMPVPQQAPPAAPLVLPSSTQIPPTIEAPKNPVQEPATAPAIAERPNFVMNGIVYASPDSYCIINGRVVKVGEKIEGATLIGVTPEKATLIYEGKTVDLWVNH